jgi:hypothetical protein
MTDPHVPDATEPEEVASAILDGEATEAERARAGEPGVAAALAAFGRVSAGLGADDPIDELARERAITAALDAWGTEDDAVPGARTAVAGDELARRRRARRGLRVVGAAAAVVVALALGGLALQGGSDDDDSADVAASAPEDTVAAGGSAGAGSAAGSEAATESALALSDLGTYDSLDALVAEAAGVATERAAAFEDGQVFDADSSGDVTATQGANNGVDGEQTSAPAADAGGGAVATCAPPPPPSGEPLAFSTATLEGRPVTVVVAGTGDEAVVQVVDVQTCEVRYEGPAG